MNNTKRIDPIAEKIKLREMIAQDVIQVLLKNELSHNDALQVLKAAEFEIGQRKII